MEERLEKAAKRKLYCKKRSTKKLVRKQSRNSKRRIRRKQNKIKYYKTLKKIRYQKSTDDLCSEVEVFDIGEMDWTPVNYPSNFPTEITDWHKQEQIAYWKSRAISLELENKMLKQHLRNVYAQTINEYSNSFEKVQKPVELYRKESKNTNEAKSQEEVIPKVPDPDVKNRLEELRKIYGAKAEKIMGMETAIQLNYERHLDQDDPIFWPSIPLKLYFE